MVVAAIVGLTASGALCAAVIGALRRLGALDLPNARSSHQRPTVRGAGVGLAFASVLGLLSSNQFAVDARSPRGASVALVLASLSAGAIGLADDLTGGISFRVRLVAQVVVASAVVAVLGVGDVTMPLRPLLAIVVLVGIVGYVNAFNFMDGINGISGVSGFVAGGMFAVVGYLEGLPLFEVAGAALAAACVGFLPFNLPTARAFLGDVGSYFIGAWIAVLAYSAFLAGVRLDVAGAPLALYLADVGFTLGSRVLRGEAWHAAHRDHAYQRLAARGLGHSGTTAVVLALSLALCGLGLVSSRLPAWRIVAWLAAAALLTGYLGAPFLLQRHQDRQARAARPRAPAGPATPPQPGRSDPGSP